MAQETKWKSQGVPHEVPKMKLVPSSGYYSVDPGIHHVGYPEEEENSSCDDSDDDDARNEEEQDDGELQNVDPHEVDRIGDLEEKQAGAELCQAQSSFS